MSSDRAGPTTTVGLHLLPNELLLSILLALPLPDLLRIRAVSRSLLSLVSAPDFHLIYSSTLLSSSSWLFLFHKRPPRRSLLRGFHPRSGRWFSFPVSDLIQPLVPPGEDLYFLAAAADLFLFASNGLRQLIAVDLSSKSVRRIPPSPLGPRGTSSWRRSALKLLADGSADGHFRFVFAEPYRNRPVLFEYTSATDAWRSAEAAEGTRVGEEEREGTCLNVGQVGSESLVMCCAGPGPGPGPVVYRPRLREEQVEGVYRLHVYGDGCMAVVRSTAVMGRMRVVVGVEVFGLSSEGREWERVSSLTGELVERIRKPYGVMMGCLERRGGVVRVVLMANCEGLWDLTWINYDREKREWEWVPVLDCGTQGLNMAGIAVSSTFVGFRT